jgi:hypothetical protein
LCPDDPCEWYSGLDLSFLSTRDFGLLFNGQWPRTRFRIEWGHLLLERDGQHTRLSMPLLAATGWVQMLRGRKGLSQRMGTWQKSAARTAASAATRLRTSSKGSATVRGIGPSQSELSLSLTAADAGRSCGVWLSNFNGDVKPLSDARSRRRLPFTQARCFARPKWIPVPWLRVWQ